MATYDADWHNTLHAEERAYQKWEREQKNRILNMTNVTRKQEEWNKLFPVFTLSDEWMNEAVEF